LSILIDSGVFYAFYNRRDIHHLDSICLLTHIFEGRYGRPYTLDLVVSEAYTLLRYRIGFKASLAFLEALDKSGIEKIFFNKDDYEGVKETLRRYNDKKLSFTDALIVYVVENYKVDILASYDTRSFSGIVKVIGKDYAKTLPKEELERIIRLVNFTKHLNYS